MKKFWESPSRNFRLSILAFTLLLGLFSWECGWLTVPTWVSSIGQPTAVTTTTNAPAPASAPDAQAAADKEEADALAACAQSQAPMCMTPATLKAFADDMNQVVMPFVKSHWLQEVTGLLMFANIITMLVFFSGWRAKKKEAEMITLPNGTKIGPPPGTKKTKARLVLPGDPEFKGRTFDDVIGQVQAVKNVKEYMEFIKHPERFEKREIKVPRGVLLHGWHGTGKTLIVGTLANELGIPVLIISGADFIEMYVGVGASRVRELYEYADLLAKHFGWCLIAIDEVDGIGGHRGSGGAGGGGQEHDQTINQLLVEMDGLIPRPRVITFGMTNLKKKLDPALLRRFPRQIEFFRPTIDDREALFRHYLPKAWVAPDFNYRQAAKTTPGGTGSDIATIGNESNILAAREGDDVLITNAHCDTAIQNYRYGHERDRKTGLMTKEVEEVIEVHEGGHALVYYELTGKAPERFTKVPRGESGGHVEYSDDDEGMKSEEQLRRDICVGLGGWAATFVELNGRQDTGPGSDIVHCTKIAVQMVKDFGMSEKIGFVALDVLKEAGLVSDSFRDEVRHEIADMVEEERQRALAIIRKRRTWLHSLIADLRENETLLADDFVAAIEKAKALETQVVEEVADIAAKVVPLHGRQRPVDAGGAKVAAAALLSVDSDDGAQERLPRWMRRFAAFVLGWLRRVTSRASSAE